MSQATLSTDVLTLEEAAEYLRLPVEVVERHAEQGQIPGRAIDGQWRFLKSAVNRWLGGQDNGSNLLQQAGAFADDPSLGELLRTIYAERGRPEV